MSDDWLSPPLRLASLGFIYDPFGALDAEELEFQTLNETFVEPELGLAPSASADESLYTFVRAPARSIAVIASPGAGKTALRRMVETWLRSDTPAVCVVRLEGLERFVDQQGALTLADYARPLLSSITAAVTAHILRLPAQYLAVDSTVQDWWWSFLVAYPAAQTLESQLQNDQLLASFGARQGRSAPFSPEADLIRTLEVVHDKLRSLGFGRLVIFVDSVDNLVDTAQLDEGLDGLTRLLGPLLRTQGLFRIKGLAWKLFLPAVLGPALETAAPVRGGWLHVRSLAWTVAGLDAFLAKRIEWASDGAYVGLEPISEQDLVLSVPRLRGSGSSLHRRLAELALARPEQGPVRTLLRIAAALFARGEGLLTRDEWLDLIAQYQPITAAEGAAPAAQRGLFAQVPATSAASALPPICEVVLRIEQSKGFVSVASVSFVRYDGGQREELLGSRVKTRLRPRASVLLVQGHDPLEYGLTLTQLFFAPRELLNAFTAAYNRAVGAGAFLRVRLAISDEFELLHAFRWELLQRPFAFEPSFLCLDEHILFSRSLPMRSGHGGAHRARRELTPLVAIASPPQPNNYSLEPLPTEQLFDDLERALKGSSLTRLIDVSLESLDSYHTDVMMLICHGRMVDKRPVLYLHDERGARGSVHPIPGGDLISHLASRAWKPTLWILASCHGAGYGFNDEHALNALGPQLSQIGLGAVLAFADDVQVVEISAGLPHLLERLRDHGQIELAVSAMRRHLARRAGSWWQGIIYLGLEDGLLWRPDP